MRNKVQLSPPPQLSGDALPHPLKSWLESLFVRVGSGPFKVSGYPVETLPEASNWGNSSGDSVFSSLIYINNESGGPTLAFSDGTNWLKVSDLTIVS